MKSSNRNIPIEPRVQALSSIEDDLTKLCEKRVTDAILSVVQICDDPKLKFAVCVMGFTVSMGIAAAQLNENTGRKYDGPCEELALALMKIIFPPASEQEPRP